MNSSITIQLMNSEKIDFIYYSYLKITFLYFNYKMIVDTKLLISIFSISKNFKKIFSSTKKMILKKNTSFSYESTKSSEVQHLDGNRIYRDVVFTKKNLCPVLNTLKAFILTLIIDRCVILEITTKGR